MRETKTKYKNGFGVMLTKCKDLKTLANVSQRTEILDFPLSFAIVVALTSDTDVRTAFKSPKTSLKKKDPLLGIQKQDRELQFVMFKY